MNKFICICCLFFLSISSHAFLKELNEAKKKAKGVPPKSSTEAADEEDSNEEGEDSLDAAGVSGSDTDKAEHGEEGDAAQEKQDKSDIPDEVRGVVLGKKEKPATPPPPSLGDTDSTDFPYVYSHDDRDRRTGSRGGTRDAARNRQPTPLPSPYPYGGLHPNYAPGENYGNAPLRDALSSTPPLAGGSGLPASVPTAQPQQIQTQVHDNTGKTASSSGSGASENPLPTEPPSPKTTVSNKPGQAQNDAEHLEAIPRHNPDSELPNPVVTAKLTHRDTDLPPSPPTPSPNPPNPSPATPSEKPPSPKQSSKQLPEIIKGAAEKVLSNPKTQKKLEDIAQKGADKLLDSVERVIDPKEDKPDSKTAPKDPDPAAGPLAKLDNDITKVAFIKSYQDYQSMLKGAYLGGAGAAGAATASGATVGTPKAIEEAKRDAEARDTQRRSAEFLQQLQIAQLQAQLGAVLQSKSEIDCRQNVRNLVTSTDRTRDKFARCELQNTNTPDEYQKLHYTGGMVAIAQRIYNLRRFASSKCKGKCALGSNENKPLFNDLKFHTAFRYTSHPRSGGNPEQETKPVKLLVPMLTLDPSVRERLVQDSHKEAVDEIEELLHQFYSVRLDKRHEIVSEIRTKIQDLNKAVSDSRVYARRTGAMDAFTSTPLEQRLLGFLNTVIDMDSQSDDDCKKFDAFDAKQYQALQPAQKGKLIACAILAQPQIDTNQPGEVFERRKSGGPVICHDRTRLVDFIYSEKSGGTFACEEASTTGGFLKSSTRLDTLCSMNKALEDCVIEEESKNRCTNPTVPIAQSSDNAAKPTQVPTPASGSTQGQDPQNGIW